MPTSRAAAVIECCRSQNFEAVAGFGIAYMRSAVLAEQFQVDLRAVGAGTQYEAAQDR